MRFKFKITPRCPFCATKLTKKGYCTNVDYCPKGYRDRDKVAEEKKEEEQGQPHE